jgi:CRISPR system Cascade subunit CasB
MPEPVPERRPEERFVDYLMQLHGRADRAALASLRRVLGKRLGDVPRADRVILPWLPSTASDRRTDAYYLIAGLFASHPLQSATHTSFGNSFRRLCDAKQRPSLELRFEALLQAREDELPEHLRHLVQLLRADAIPIDWVQLLRDVLAWTDPERRVQRRWARDFWAAVDAVSPNFKDVTGSASQETTDVH